MLGITVKDNHYICQEPGCGKTSNYSVPDLDATKDGAPWYERSYWCNDHGPVPYITVETV